MDPIPTSITSLDSTAASSVLMASGAQCPPQPQSQPSPSVHTVQAQDASSQVISPELGARKRPQTQVQNVPKRPRSTIFDPSSTTVSHWSKRPRKPIVLKPAPVAAVSRREDAHPLETGVVATVLGGYPHGGIAPRQDCKKSKGQEDPVEGTAVVTEGVCSETNVTTAKASSSLSSTAKETPNRSVATATSKSMLQSSLTSGSTTYLPSSLAPSPFVTPSLASFLSASKPTTTLPRKPSSSSLNTLSSSSSSSTFSRSSSLLSSTISSASGPSRTSSTSSLSSVSTSTSSSAPNSRSSSSSSLRRGQTNVAATRYTFARSSSQLRQSSLADFVSAKLQPLDNRLGWTERESLPQGVVESTELEEDYSFLVTPNVMAVSDELLSLSCPSYTADDLEVLVSQESTCNECSSCSSPIPLPCPDYVLQPLEDHVLEWQQNRSVQSSSFTNVTRTPTMLKATTTKASLSEQDENIHPFRPVLMDRSKTTQATLTEAAAPLSPMQRPNGLRRHKTMQGIKNEYKVTSASAVVHDLAGHEVAAAATESTAADPHSTPTSVGGGGGLLPPSAHEAVENQILPYTDPPSGSNDFAKRISGTTLVRVLEGHYKHQYEELMLIDCRFAYEYQGGHIRGAVNVRDKKELERILFGQSPLIHKKVLVILHCEFSCERGPGMARHLRSMDRTANSINYPALFYPELYVLSGGYSRFFRDHPDYCTPCGYVAMLDVAYSHEYERARKAHRSVFGRTASKGFLGMEAGSSKSAATTTTPLLASRNSGYPIKILHDSNRSNSNHSNSNSSSSNNNNNNNNNKTVLGQGLRSRAKTIPDLRTVAKLNLDQLRRHARATE
ncbi:cell division cycle- protein [Actinomortierella ambigua]|nr:cell division cycle- protein [Actinomortierella ambigua]